VVGDGSAHEMTFLSWRENYAVHVPQIDSEHRNLFGLINGFHDQGAGGATLARNLHMLNRLVAYAEEHFQHEEAMMKHSGYSRLDYHREKHANLFSSIFELNSRFAAGTAKVDSETQRFLKHWLVEHILKDDLDCGDFLLRKAVQAGKAAGQTAKKDPPPR